jgi:glycosyltransferase involved in cell wall biosynthesis
MIACFYIEGWEYQENILPRFHKKMGLDVNIVSTRFTKNEKNEAVVRDAEKYMNSDGIEVQILDYHRPNFIQKLLNFKPISGLPKTLIEIRPDIVFIHGIQFPNIFDVIKYKKENPSVKIFCDQHGDYYNMPVNTMTEKIYQKIIFRYFASRIAKHSEKIWGVTPWRVDYLREVYKINKNKIGLLVMGGDDSKIDFSKQTIIRVKRRLQLNIQEEDFVLISGGKLDKSKNILSLMKAVTAINSKSIKLVIFGSINNDINSKFNQILKSNPNIHFINWITADVAYEWFLSADLAIFPGTHSVLWEQAIACGLPTVFKKWEGMTHVDIGGNCEFLLNGSSTEIQEVIKKIALDKNKYSKMKHISMAKGTQEFSYSKIAKKSILWK